MRVTRKWRPSLGALIAVVVGFLVGLPFLGLVAARVTSDQFVQETEASLHMQAAVYAALFADLYDGPPEGAVLTQAQAEALAQDFTPVSPSLAAADRLILPPRPDALPMDVTPPAYAAALSRVAAQARRTTLAGVLFVDHTGAIIARSGTDAGSLAHIPEVAQALAGAVTSVARWRTEEYRNHSLRSLSRDTKFRVFVAHPVVVEDRVVGAVYVSRTPSNLNKYLFQQRHTFMWLFVALAVTAALVGWFLWRFLTRPLRGLGGQAADIARGADRGALPNYGVREIAGLGQSIMDMGASLRRQSAAMESYTKHATHELKSPVTSIIAAAELLEAEGITDARRETLARAIQTDAARMDDLLGGMRAMVRGRLGFADRPVTLAEAARGITEVAVAVEGAGDAVLPMPAEATAICLGHIAQNAVEHGATRLTLTFDGTNLTATDNGAGLSAANAPRALEPFFTTKRDTGGTGLGLAICAEIAQQFGGALTIADTGQGACVTIRFEELA